MLHHLEKTTFWLTAGIPSIRQHGDNIALNVGKETQPTRRECKHQRRAVRSEPLQAAVMDVQQI